MNSFQVAFGGEKDLDSDEAGLILHKIPQYEVFNCDDPFAYEAAGGKNQSWIGPCPVAAVGCGCRVAISREAGESDFRVSDHWQI
jgi:hypothetical protein